MNRENAIEWFTMLKEKFVNTEYEKYLEMAIEALEQEPKTGHWIDDDDGFGTRCSECGKWYPNSYLTRQEVIYCCRCGTKIQ